MGLQVRLFAVSLPHRTWSYAYYIGLWKNVIRESDYFRSSELIAFPTRSIRRLHETANSGVMRSFRPWPSTLERLGGEM